MMKLHRKVKHNEKVCCAHDFGSYAQGQGRNQVRGQNRVSGITQKLQKQRRGVNKAHFVTQPNLLITPYN